MPPAAATAAAASGTALSAVPGSLPGLGQTLLSLLLVLGVIFALGALLKRVQGARSGGNSNLRVNASLSVGPKERVLLIEAGGAHLLVGVAAGRVQTLHVYAEPPVLADAATGNANPPLSTAFAEALKRALGQETKS